MLLLNRTGGGSLYMTLGLFGNSKYFYSIIGGMEMNKLFNLLLAFLGTFIIGVTEIKAEDHPIFSAVASGDIKNIRKVLDSQPASIHEKNKDGETPLLFVADMRTVTISGPNANFSGTFREGDATAFERVAAFLIERGADLDARDSDDNTTLNKAITSKKRYLANLLIDKGANVNAVIRSDSERKGITALHFAAGYREIGIVKKLISKGADINVRTDSGLTPLHLTALSGAYKVAEFLIKSGADVNITDAKGQSALEIALSGNAPSQKKIVDILRRHGAKEPNGGRIGSHLDL